MKKILFFITVAMLLTSVAWSQNWVGFTKSELGAPELNLLSSNSKTVSFEVTIPGIYATDTVVNGTAFTRLILPDGGAINPAGYPAIPVLSYKIAIPDCAGVSIESQILSTQPMQSCWVYPVSEIVPDPNGTPVKQFTFNADAYAQLRTPEPVAVVSSSRALRAQRFVEVIVQPVEFCPVTRQLSVIDKVEITLTFDNPTSDIRQNVGIFNKIAANAFINYQDDGMSALENDKVFENPDFMPGNVHWINLTDTAQAKNIVADYLIITVPEFFTPNDPNSQLARLANHRAWYNGFDVAIVNVQQILNLNFYYEGNPYDPNDPDKYKDEQRIRTCIRRIYEGNHAHHTKDGKLGYVLLVGDYANGIGIPGPTEHHVCELFYEINFGDQTYRSDYYYTCITKDDATGKYDHYGDLYIGRFSVEHNNHLFNMVQKTIFHETDFSNMSWRHKAGFTNNMTYFDYNIIYHYNIPYFNVVDYVFVHCGWTYSKVVQNPLLWEIKKPTLNYFNSGTVFVQYLGSSPSSYNSWSDNLNISYFQDSLRNDYMAPFVSSVGTPTSRFDNVESLGEFLTRYDSIKGAVGLIGSTRYIGVQIAECETSKTIHQEELLKNLFYFNISVAGELLLTYKYDDYPTSGGALEYKYAYNLLGDPALNIRADLVCRREIRITETIHNGETLRVPNDCSLRFFPNGKLIVEEGGTLEIEDGAQIYGENCEEDITIHIKGGDFIVGDNVTFNNLNQIILSRTLHGVHVYDPSKIYNLQNATFNNTPLYHEFTTLNASNCTFNAGSNVNTNTSFAKFTNCIFNNARLRTDNGKIWPPPLSYPGTHVMNCNFNSLLNSGTALTVTGTRKIIISNNIISGYATGISVTASGQTQSGKGIDPGNNQQTATTDDLINKNTISNCNRGIELYNSVAKINSNHIFNNGSGIWLYNNSYTSFGNLTAPPATPQIIQDNDSYELYADASSFPVTFKYNQIIDEDNQGNSKNDPLLYYDISTKGIDPGPGYQLCTIISYNYWGENFVHNEDIYPPKHFCTSPIWVPPGKVTLSPEEELYEIALEYFTLEEYASAKTTFLSLIETYPQSQFAIAALHELFALEQFMDNDYFELQNYFATFTPADSNLFAVAEFLGTRCYVQERSWQPAINWYENRIENPPSYQDSIFAVIDLGDIHLRMEADTAGSGTKSSASACFYRFKNIKPKSKQEYETNKADLLATLPQIKKSQPINSLSSDKKGALGQNVPNPATGTTTIAYGINTEGAVEINIYNAMGQLVKSFPQGALKEGNYQAKISLASMPNGIYSYVLLVNGERADAKKMVVNQ